MTYSPPPTLPSKVLPPEAREMLRRAVREHQKSSEFDRQKAIEAAIRRVKALYPECFLKE